MGDILDVLLLMCMNGKHPLLQLEYLKEVKLCNPSNITGIYTVPELQTMKIKEQNKEIQEKDEEIKEL